MSLAAELLFSLRCVALLYSLSRFSGIHIAMQQIAGIPIRITIC